MMQKRKILIVDDIEIIRRVFKQIFEEVEGWEVETAEDGIAALETIHASRFDVIITNIVMPKLDGIALLDRLIEQLCLTPIIIMSGLLKEAEIPNLKAKGAFDCFQKPVNIPVLIQTIKLAFEEHDRRILSVKRLLLE